ncbi:MAG: HAD family hydrolase [Elainellaceae cyanobacterium]
MSLPFESSDQPSDQSSDPGSELLPRMKLLPDVLDDVRLVATDMDGTLTRRGYFSADLMAALQALQGANIHVLVVTGRSAGWVNGLVSYLPIAGAIAENGGLFFSSEDDYRLIADLGNLPEHRQKLTATFQHLKGTFPNLREALDNAFRFSDWTFDVSGLSQPDLAELQHQCQSEGWSFTYSNIQCHIKPARQDKATALQHVLAEDFPGISPQSVITIGDSLNDESLFNPAVFPRSVGVANLREVSDRLTYTPTYITAGSEVDGFCELTKAILANCG